MKCLSTVAEELLFCFLPYTVWDLLTSAAFPHKTCWITHRGALRNAGTQLADDLTVAPGWLRSAGWGHKGKCRRWGGRRWQGWRAAGSPGSPRESGAAAGARLGLPGGGWSGGGRQGEPANSAVPSRRLESIWVSQLRAGLPLYPQHTPASRRPADTLPLIYRHRFVAHSWCLRDSADFTLA